MTQLETIAESVWTNATRTLASGSPSAPVTELDYIAQAVWEHDDRTVFVVHPSDSYKWKYRGNRFGGWRKAAGIWRGRGTSAAQGPFCSIASQFHVPGTICAQHHTPGSIKSQHHTPGSVSAQTC